MIAKGIYKYSKWELENMSIKCQKIVLVAQDKPGDVHPTIWAEHGDNDVLHNLMYFGTGRVIPRDYEHVSSCKCGPFVWHVYSMGAD